MIGAIKSHSGGVEGVGLHMYVLYAWDCGMGDLVGFGRTSAEARGLVPSCQRKERAGREINPLCRSVG